MEKKIVPMLDDLNLKDTSVLITGGSSGIGLALAEQCVLLGAHVTIFARDIQKLENAHKNLKSLAQKDQKIAYSSVDVSDFIAVNAEVESVWERVGTIDSLFNCAGLAIPSSLDKLSEHDIQNMIGINLIGTIYVTQALLKLIKKHDKIGGQITMVGSLAGLIGIYGYSVYSASKFGLRGFAEAIKMELFPHEITVTLAIPPDTDTPGFQIEEQNKPEITRKISEVAGLVKPEEVAAQILQDSLAGNFISAIGLEGKVMSTACAGLSPYNNICSLLTEVCFMGIARLFGVTYLNTIYSKIKHLYQFEDENKTE